MILSTVSANGRAICWPHIYNPSHQFGHTRFDIVLSRKIFRKPNCLNCATARCDECNAPWQVDSDNTYAVLERFERNGFVRFSSGRRPEVLIQDFSDDPSNAQAIDRMSQELRRLDVRNINRDEIFKLAGMVTIHFSVYSSHWGYGLSLEKIGIAL